MKKTVENTKSEAEFVGVYDGVCSSLLCEQLRKHFDASPDVYEGKTGSGRSLKKRNTELYLDPSLQPALDQQVFELFSRFTRDYFERFAWLNFPYRDVGYFIKRYRAGCDFYDTHVDVSALKNSSRVLVGILYLNTVEEGGETEFTHLNLKVQPREGRMLLFPPMWMYPHRANMPVTQDKYTLNTFFVLDR